MPTENMDTRNMYFKCQLGTEKVGVILSFIMEGTFSITADIFCDLRAHLLTKPYTQLCATGDSQAMLTWLDP